LTVQRTYFCFAALRAGLSHSLHYRDIVMVLMGTAVGQGDW
jgi:hypothetical protein